MFVNFFSSLQRQPGGAPRLPERRNPRHPEAPLVRRLQLGRPEGAHFDAAHHSQGDHLFYLILKSFSVDHECGKNKRDRHSLFENYTGHGTTFGNERRRIMSNMKRISE